MEKSIQELSEQLKKATIELSRTNTQNRYFEDDSDLDAKITINFDVSNKTGRGTYKIHGSIPINFVRTFEAHKLDTNTLLNKTSASTSSDKQNATETHEKSKTLDSQSNTSTLDAPTSPSKPSA